MSSKPTKNAFNPKGPKGLPEDPKGLPKSPKGTSVKVPQGLPLKSTGLALKPSELRVARMDAAMKP